MVLEVDTAANQIRARESDSTRIRTIELGERSAIFSGRDTLAQAGGKQPEKLDEALAVAKAEIEKALA